jgi:DNA-binding transcriptional ArsR family regulator
MQTASAGMARTADVTALDLHLTISLNEDMTNASDPLSTIFAALADPTRRAIQARLSEGDAPVSELARPFDISAPAISRHLRVLADAGLIEREINARWRICHLRPGAMRDAHGWLESYRRLWEGNLDRLVAFVEQTQTETAVTDRKKGIKS